MSKDDKPGVFFLDESGRPELPDQTNYDDAENLAKEAIARLKPEVQAKRCGGRVLKAAQTYSIVQVDFFNTPVDVKFPDGKVTGPQASEVPIWERILLLHYLGGDTMEQSHTEWIGFQQVPSGGFYFDAFKRRSHDPLAKVFGREPDKLLEAGEAIGAQKADFGDAAVLVHAFPKIPVVAVVHAADDEFPADAKILFKSSIQAYLCTEDIAVLGGLVAGKLVKAFKNLK
ncbi:DUF3786 domain-containing protein [Myxococcota bacterium]